MGKEWQTIKEYQGKSEGPINYATSNDTMLWDIAKGLRHYLHNNLNRKLVDSDFDLVRISDEFIGPDLIYVMHLAYNGLYIGYLTQDRLSYEMVFNPNPKIDPFKKETH